jgi:hypothetical protein
MENNSIKKNNYFHQLKKWLGSNSYSFKVILPTIMGIAFLMVSGVTFIMSNMATRSARIFSRYNGGEGAGSAYFEELASTYMSQMFVSLIIGCIFILVAIYFYRKT